MFSDYSDIFKINTILNLILNKYPGWPPETENAYLTILYTKNARTHTKSFENQNKKNQHFCFMKKNLSYSFHIWNSA